MTAKAWTLGLGASVLLHGVGLAAIGLTTEPEELPDQPVPKSQFSIEAAEVPRSRAEAQAAAGDTASEAQADSTAAASGAVPQTVARPATLNGTTLAAQPATATKLAASQNAGNALSAQTDLSTKVAAVAAKSATITAAVAAPAVAQSATPETAQAVALSTTSQITSAAVLSAPALTESQSDSPAQASVVPTAQPAPTATPQGPKVDQSPLPATAGKATLAWAGEDTAAVSAESLAAIAAFTQEGDLSAASAQVRDGIEGILAAVPCARLQTTFLPETGQLELRGHIPEEGLKGPVLAALRAQVGDAIPLSEELLILPRPQCGALAGIAGVGLPQSNEQLDNPKVIGADGFARNTTYFDGDAFYLEMTGADYDAYLYVDYFDKDGNVIHLQPNEFVPNELVPADAEVLVARSDGDKPALELTISAPFGQEIAAAFAASVPLYDGNRPLVEPAEPYLAFLKEQVAKARAEHADFKGEWVYFFITTKPR